MKKSYLFILTAILAVVSCTSNDFYDLQTVKEEKFINDFNDVFNVNKTDYANHQWGMNFVPMIDITNKVSRSANPNGNEWADNGYVVPDDITTEELEAVLAVFNEPGEASYTSLVDWNDFFVQQVYKGTKHYTAGNGADLIGSDHMDWLCTVAKQKVEVICWWPYEEKVVECDPYDDHIFDFNNSNSEDYGGRMLMLNSNTNKFGYFNSEDSKVHYEFRMEKINGNYYVGFDFYGNGGNPNQNIDRDFIYNDWIVKIVPATGSTPSVERVRIMCEDLASSVSDFDYNDVVFDIKFIKNGNTYTADIILQAAGGTLPLTIGGNEVHSLFAEQNPDANITEKTMINTAPGKHNEFRPVHFTVTLPNSNYDTAWDAINDLPVLVKNPDNQLIKLTVSPGEPAEMIAVSVNVNWSNEKAPIQSTYPSFVDWIRDSTVIWWE